MAVNCTTCIKTQIELFPMLCTRSGKCDWTVTIKSCFHCLQWNNKMQTVAKIDNISFEIWCKWLEWATSATAGPCLRVHADTKLSSKQTQNMSWAFVYVTSVIGRSNNDNEVFSSARDHGSWLTPLSHLTNEKSKLYAKKDKSFQKYKKIENNPISR